MVAIAMSMFQLAGVVCPPIHSVTMVKMGRKNAIIVGFLCMIIANTGLGLLSWIPDDSWILFFVLSILIRFLQGYGDSLATTVDLALITANFSENRIKYVGIMEASAGVGMILGPPMGGLIYSYMDYACTFYIFSIIISLNLIIQIINVPSILNKKDKSADAEVLDMSSVSVRSVSKMHMNSIISESKDRREKLIEGHAKKVPNTSMDISDPYSMLESL